MTSIDDDDSIKLPSLTRRISPPPRRKPPKPSPAAVEAGQTQIRNHLEYFTERLTVVSRLSAGPKPYLNEFRRLYERNQREDGHHFVVHQHDHPISGVHYDLRLQFSKSSSISFAVPYGLPGNPNSHRPNRMAIETRVHNLWNHLIESASHATGSLLIWDCGEYEVLDREQQRGMKMTDDEGSENEHAQVLDGLSHSQKLFAAFQTRHIRLRLNGTRLPEGYTLSLRLPSANNRASMPSGPKTKRRRVDPTSVAEREKQKATPVDSSEDGSDRELADQHATSVSDGDVDAAVASEGEGEGEDEEASIRANNAYPGSTNTIGSVHQRHWFLTLDKKASGFYRADSGPDKGSWVGPWEPFYVHGRDHERSVVTGRMADDVMSDEGVTKFAGRKMWRPILE